MKRFLGIEQKKNQRKINTWINNLSDKDLKKLNITKPK